MAMKAWFRPRKWKRLRDHTNPLPESEKIYLVAFATTVDRARTDGLHTIPVPGISDIDSQFRTVVDWCSDHGCQLIWDRVLWDPWQEQWTNNEIAGGDMLFVLTSNDDIATLARLIWS